MGKPSTGFWWSIFMLALMVVEVMVLTEILFSEGKEPPGAFMMFYFYVAVITCVVQLIGILLVSGGKYRLGGLLQIIASAPHVLKLEGMVGVIGGTIAYNYPEALEETGEKAPQR